MDTGKLTGMRQQDWWGRARISSSETSSKEGNVNLAVKELKMLKLDPRIIYVGKNVR